MKVDTVVPVAYLPWLRLHTYLDSWRRVTTSLVSGLKCFRHVGDGHKTARGEECGDVNSITPGDGLRSAPLRSSELQVFLPVLNLCIPHWLPLEPRYTSYGPRPSVCFP